MSVTASRSGSTSTLGSSSSIHAIGVILASSPAGFQSSRRGADLRRVGPFAGASCCRLARAVPLEAASRDSPRPVCTRACERRPPRTAAAPCAGRGAGVRLYLRGARRPPPGAGRRSGALPSRGACGRASGLSSRRGVPSWSTLWRRDERDIGRRLDSVVRSAPRSKVVDGSAPGPMRRPPGAPMLAT